MLKLYRVLPDETTVVYSQRQADKTVIVHLERPTEHGFDSARCRLAPVRWLEHSGYSRWEICAFETMLLREEEQLLALAEAARSAETPPPCLRCGGGTGHKKALRFFGEKHRAFKIRGKGIGVGQHPQRSTAWARLAYWRWSSCLRASCNT